MSVNVITSTDFAYCKVTLPGALCVVVCLHLGFRCLFIVVFVWFGFLFFTFFFFSCSFEVVFLVADTFWRPLGEQDQAR